MALIELNGITFAYGPEEAPVMNKLNLTVEQGSCLVLEGDNGSGKTTLFRILNGLSFPQSGSYRFDGTEITERFLKDNRASKAFHKRIGYLFQNPDIMLFNASVYDEVAFGPRQMGLSDEEVAKRTAELLDLFNLGELADKAPYHLSGGQKKRVALAAVMSLNPDVIVLDEPYAGLDRKTMEWLTTFLKDLKRAGKTLILATHRPEVAEVLADQVFVLGES